MRPRLLVIQHELDDHLNELAGPLVDAGLAIEPWFAYRRPAPPRDVSEYDGVLSLGAIAGVEDEADLRWMSVERQLLEKAVAGGVPTLGVCFGAQLLASVGGAPVRKAERPEIGWAQVEMASETAGDPVLGALGPRPTVFQFHYDTFGEPENGSIVGRTGALNQVVKVGEKAWGVQFHLEVSPGAIYSWIATYGDEMRTKGTDLETLKKETAERWQTYRDLARGSGEAFAREVAEFSKRREPVTMPGVRPT
ncbi:MAG TPA: type 1 glutamine amidotransferase [Actinomycetota bacterium]|jgi:GMP synthase (glutamine-hydrolysing)